MQKSIKLFVLYFVLIIVAHNLLNYYLNTYGSIQFNLGTESVEAVTNKEETDFEETDYEETDDEETDDEETDNEETDNEETDDEDDTLNELESYVKKTEVNGLDDDVNYSNANFGNERTDLTSSVSLKPLQQVNTFELDVPTGRQSHQGDEKVMNGGNWMQSITAYDSSSQYATI